MLQKDASAVLKENQKILIPKSYTGHFHDNGN